MLASFRGFSKLGLDYGKVGYIKMCYSQNHGPIFLVRDYIGAPNLQGYQMGTPILGTSRISSWLNVQKSALEYLDPKSM